MRKPLPPAIDIRRNGVTIAVARALRGEGDSYTLAGHFLLPDGELAPFQWPMTVVARKALGRPKGSGSCRRARVAIAARAAKRYCELHGRSVTLDAHKLCDFASLRSVNKAANKITLGAGAWLVVPPAERSPSDFVAFIPSGCVQHCDGRDLHCHGSVWTPRQREAEFQQLRMKAAEKIPDAWRMALGAFMDEGQ